MILHRARVKDIVVPSLNRTGENLPKYYSAQNNLLAGGEDNYVYRIDYRGTKIQEYQLPEKCYGITHYYL